MSKLHQPCKTRRSPRQLGLRVIARTRNGLDETSRIARIAELQSKPGLEVMHYLNDGPAAEPARIIAEY
ncbi:hypothetical protein CFY91_05190 [Pseudomonas fluvialis]|nr:hypothetical protein CFY91_05190 [Pseudomonas fluvialis]